MRASITVLLPIFILATGSQRLSAAQILHLPYPAGVSVQVIQGYNGGTHASVERYSLDLVRSDGATSGSQAIAPASGTVAFAQLPASEHGCIGVAMDDSSDFHYMLCHLLLNRVYGFGDRIQVGQSLGTVGPPGMVGNNGSAHIHMQLYTLPGQQRTPVPFAPPLGIPLEGATMPSDGSYNEWACSGASCHPMLSSNPSTGPILVAGPTGGNVSLTIGGVTVGGALSVGKPAVVHGTDTCLRVHDQPSVSATSNGCAPDGTVVFLSDGPKQADGYTWWYLRSLGWSVSEYLNSATDSSGTSSLSSAPARQQPGDAGAAADGGNSSSTTRGVAIGSVVQIAGTGDCLKVHDAPTLDAPVVACLRDGARATVKDGPKKGDGHDWWLLDSGGWAASDYLQAGASQ